MNKLIKNNNKKKKKTDMSLPKLLNNLMLKDETKKNPS
jgi:hypothetical protein